MEQPKANRIGYIDALRGMTMILVVYFHIAAYGFGSYELGYNDIIERFRMPTFFFISGGVIKSEGGGKMNEIGPHHRWAEKIVRRANVYGVVKNEDSVLNLVLGKNE